MGDVRLRAETPAAHTDAVLEAEDRRDKAVIDAVDVEREHADL